MLAGADGADEVVAVQAGLRPSSFQTKYRKLSNLRQVPTRLGRGRVVCERELFAAVCSSKFGERENLRLGRS